VRACVCGCVVCGVCGGVCVCVVWCGVCVCVCVCVCACVCIYIYIYECACVGCVWGENVEGGTCVTTWSLLTAELN